METCESAECESAKVNGTATFALSHFRTLALP